MVERRAIAISFVVLGVAACGRNAAVSTNQSAAAAGPPTIEVTRVVEQPVSVTLSLPGELTSYQTVAIVARVTGFVKRIRVDRGSRVRAGELLAELEAPELVAQRAEAQSKLQGAAAQLAAVQSKADADQSTYDKLKAAASTPGVVAGNDLVLAEKAVEAAQSQLTAAQQTVEAARQALNAIRDMESYLRVTAPFDGVVTERNVHPGALVGPAGGAGAAPPIVRIADNRRLRLVVPVPEAYASNVPAGAPIAFSVSAYPDRTFSGTIARLGQTVDVSTRTMAVELDVDNRDAALAPGAFCQVRWAVRRSGPSLFVPSGSVASTTGRTFVVRVRDGKAEWIDVKTGLASGALIEVFGELRAGDEVATRGTDEIRPGAEVHTRAAKPASS
jgi:membrane fusion protein, multidrug efflux system